MANVEQQKMRVRQTRREYDIIIRVYERNFRKVRCKESRVKNKKIVWYLYEEIRECRIEKEQSIMEQKESKIEKERVYRKKRTRARYENKKI